MVFVSDYVYDTVCDGLWVQAFRGGRLVDTQRT